MSDINKLDYSNDFNHEWINNWVSMDDALKKWESRLEKTRSISFLEQLDKLEEFNYFSLEDFMDDKEVVNFVSDNFTNKNENWEYIINDEVLAKIKKLFKEFIKMESWNKLVLKDNFSLSVEGRKFYIAGDQFDWLKDSNLKNVYIKYIHWELVYDIKPNSFASKAILFAQEQEISNNLNNNIDNINNNIDKKKLFEQIVKDATDLTFNWDWFESKLLDESNLTINTNFSILWNKIQSGVLIINWEEINYNNLTSDTKKYIENAILDWKNKIRKEMQWF